MLWGGAVADPADRDTNTLAIRALNEKIRDDARVDACLLTVGDGVLLARRREVSRSKGDTAPGRARRHRPPATHRRRAPVRTRRTA
jgi:hypothetical protein